MYSMENYYWGGVAYVLGVLLLTPALWWMTRFMKWHPLKAFFRVLVLAVLLTPAYAFNDMIYLAPAWTVSVFEAINPQTEQGVSRGLVPIVFCFAVVYVLDLCFWLLLRNRRSKPARRAAREA